MPRRFALSGQRGVTIFVVMVMVLLTTLMLLWASRSARFNELITGNDADYQRALEAAQAMVRDAEFDIRGTGPNDEPCVPEAPAVCRGAAVTAAPAAAYYPMADESDLNATLEETLDAQTPSCIAGICTPTHVTPEFWNTKSTLDAMKDRGATYGSFTGTKTAAIGSALLLHGADTPARAWYWVEILHYNWDRASSGEAGYSKDLIPDSTSPYVYRITAVAEGRKPGTRAVVQTVFVRRKAKS